MGRKRREYAVILGVKILRERERVCVGFRERAYGEGLNIVFVFVCMVE